MIDYKLKSSLINSKMLEDYKFYSKTTYLEYCYKCLGCEFDGDLSIQFMQAHDIAMYYKKYYPKEWKECSRISNSYRARVRRLKDRISKIVYGGDCIFLTFTFNDKTLLNTSATTRRDKIKRFLSSLECPYVANIDFGKRNHREHYHAVVGTTFIDYSKWTMGIINGIKIRNETDDIARLSKYVAKLTNHAIKETTKRSVIMYSRKY